MDDKTVITLSVTIILAFAGYFVKYINDIVISRRKDRLDRINLQLKNLYGILYAVDQSSSIVWNAFRSKYRVRIPYFATDSPPTKEEEEIWRLWILEVFMPLNLIMEKAIIENSDLIIENEMPQCLLKLIAHISAYKPVIKKWQNGDFSEHLSMTGFPKEDLRPYIEKSYFNLRQERAAILGKIS